MSKGTLVKSLIKGITKNGSGGGNIGTGDYNVKVIDYDGTVIAEKNLNEGESFTLPKAPKHDGLVFQEWSATQDITDGKITVGKSDVMIGAIYTTASGQNEFDITLTAITGLSVTLNLDGTKDWGDGTTDTNTSHTYTQAGDYTIKCNGTTMTTSSSSGLFGQLSSNINYYVTNIRLAGITTISSYAFQYCYSLKNITIPKEVISIGEGGFQYCYSISSVTIPSSVTSFQSLTCSRNYSLKNIIIPKGVTRIGDASLYFCYSLQKIAIPSSVTTVRPSAFEGDACIVEYDFSTHTSIPTLSNINAFSNINKICKIKVPSALYDQWITETNWVTYADYIVAI